MQNRIYENRKKRFKGRKEKPKWRIPNIKIKMAMKYLKTIHLSKKLGKFGLKQL